MTIKIDTTPGEEFKAHRRRLGLSHPVLAKKMKIPQSTIKCWEDDVPSAPELDISLNEGERYYVLRERLGLPLKKAAKLIGISHPTLIKLEKQEGGHEVLRAFYKKYLTKRNIKIKGITLT